MTSNPSTKVERRGAASPSGPSTWAITAEFTVPMKTSGSAFFYCVSTALRRGETGELRASGSAYTGDVSSQVVSHCVVADKSVQDYVVVTVGWAANKNFEILKFEFKFPRARTFELFRARSRRVEVKVCR